MSLVTAQILVGEGKIGHGITPRWQLTLTQGARSSWTLISLVDPAFKPVTWLISADERALEDGLILVGYYCYKDPGILSQVESTVSNVKAQTVDLAAEAHTVDLEVLCDLIRKLTDGKLILSVFEGSLVLEQLAMLDWYKFNLEITLPAYTRTWHGETKTWSDRGSLDVPDLD